MIIHLWSEFEQPLWRVGTLCTLYRMLGDCLYSWGTEPFLFSIILFDWTFIVTVFTRANRTDSDGVAILGDMPELLAFITSLWLGYIETYSESSISKVYISRQFIFEMEDDLFSLNSLTALPFDDPFHWYPESFFNFFLANVFFHLENYSSLWIFI